MGRSKGGIDIVDGEELLKKNPRVNCFNVLGVEYFVGKVSGRWCFAFCVTVLLDYLFCCLACLRSVCFFRTLGCEKTIIDLERLRSGGQVVGGRACSELDGKWNKLLMAPTQMFGVRAGRRKGFFIRPFSAFSFNCVLVGKAGIKTVQLRILCDCN